MSAPGEQPQFEELLQQAIEENEILRDRVTELEALLVAAEDEIDKRDQAIQELLALTASKTKHNLENDEIRNMKQTSIVIDRLEQLTNLGQDNDVEDNGMRKQGDVNKGQSKNHIQGKLLLHSQEEKEQEDASNRIDTNANGRNHRISSLNSDNNYSSMYNQLSQDNQSEQSSSNNGRNLNYCNSNNNNHEFSQRTEGYSQIMSQQEQSQDNWNCVEKEKNKGRVEEGQDEEVQNDDKGGQVEEEEELKGQHQIKQVEEEEDDEDNEDEDKQLNFANIKKRIHKLKK